MSGTKTRIESMLDVQAYLQNLCYALDHGAVVTFQKERQVDNDRDNRFTNNYTVNDLFPNENPVEVLRKELRTSSFGNHTVFIMSFHYAVTPFTDNTFPYKKK